MSLFRVHPHRGQPRAGERKGPGGKLQLQLSPYHAEQGVSQEGALQQWVPVPFDAG